MPFLGGLLPDREDVRAEMGREFGVNGRNAFQLLRTSASTVPAPSGSATRPK